MVQPRDTYGQSTVVVAGARLEQRMDERVASMDVKPCVQRYMLGQGPLAGRLVMAGKSGGKKRPRTLPKTPTIWFWFCFRRELGCADHFYGVKQVVIDVNMAEFQPYVQEYWLFSE